MAITNADYVRETLRQLHQACAFTIDRARLESIGADLERLAELERPGEIIKTDGRWSD